jgi:hypothetical protein
MATNNSYSISEIDGRLEYISQVVKALEKGQSVDGKAISPATVHTQAYVRKCERETLLLIKELMRYCPDGIANKLSVVSRDTFARLTKAPSNRKTTLPEGSLKAGDDWLVYLTNNPHTTKAQIDRYLELHGLKADGTKVIAS